MRRIQLRQRGIRPQGTPFTGENPNKEVVATVEAEATTEKKATRKKTVKKETVVDKVKKAIKKVVK